MDKKEIFDYDKYLTSTKSSDNKNNNKSKSNSKNRKKQKSAPAKPVQNEKIIKEVADTQDKEITENSTTENEAVETPENVIEELSIEDVPKLENYKNLNDENIFLEDPNKSKDKLSDTKLLKAFNDVLDEDIRVIEEMTFRDDNNISKPKKKKSFKRTLYFSIGIFVSLMSLIGIIFSVEFIVDGIKSIADNTKLKNELAQFILPVVINDPPMFESIESVPNETILSSAIWDIIINGDTDKYESESGMMSIPAIEVDKHAASLFGQGLKLEHQSVGNFDVFFAYDEEKDVYTVPVSPRFLSYSPYIEKFEKVGERYTIRVGYVAPTPQWLQESDSTPVVDKYVEYVVTKHNDKYCLIAINSLYDGEPTS